MNFQPISMLFVAMLVGRVAYADMITYKDGALDPFLETTYAGTEDVGIFHESNIYHTTSNFGGRGDFSVGRTITSLSGVGHSFVRFDITSFADKYQFIDSVTLRLYQNFADGSGVVEIHEVSTANAGWVEGTQSNGPGTGASTWSKRIQGSESWAGSVGASTAGIDYLTPVIASATHTTSTTIVDFQFSDVSFIDDWILGNNSGLYLRAETEAVRNRVAYYSADTGNASLHPELIISFTAAVPEPSTYALFAMMTLGLAAIKRSRRQGVSIGSVTLE